MFCSAKANGLTTSAKSVILVQITQFVQLVGESEACGIMEKTINAFEVRRSFGKIVQGILSRGDKYVVERHGTPVAVVVPVEVYEQWKQSRERFFASLRMAQENANLSADEAGNLAEEAVKASRLQA
jgi:prevent-host-death family protein